jgi:3'-5' exoribonuclease
LKRAYIKDIVKDTLVNDFFIVVKKGIFTSKNGSRYMTARLRDKTGTIEARIWDRVDELSSAFDRNDLVYVHSKAKTYQDAIQLTVTDIEKVDKELSLEDMREFYPENESGSARARDAFYSLIEGINNAHVKSLFTCLTGRKDLLDRFFLVPASVGVHHMYMGGLLEHSVTIAEMGKRITSLTETDTDLVVGGCLLHDIGKVDEITVKGGFVYSDRGRLLGHIVLGVMILDDLIREAGQFPDDLADVLRHIVVSHHGEQEWGSPKKPMCLEAMVVHSLDNLDARLSGVREYMMDGMEDERWTQYHRLYESRFYRIPVR